MENWLSSGRPKRGRTSTPGTKSSTFRRFAATDSRIVVSPTTSAPPGTVLWISSRACSVVARRSGKKRGPSTTTGGRTGGAPGTPAGSDDVGGAPAGGGDVGSAP